MRHVLLFSAALSMAALLGCQPTAEVAQPKPIQFEEEKSDPAKPFMKELKQIAKDYTAWGRVDDEARWGPLSCRLPKPSVSRFSASKDADTHGQKLYSMFAKNREDYAFLKWQSMGQIIVKESWVPEETTEVKPGDIDTKKTVNDGIRPRIDGQYYPYATKGDKVFKASKFAGLYIMMKVDPKSPDADEGWVYGTISADLKTVTASGKIESCMKCHQDAKSDRLFGLPAK